MRKLLSFALSLVACATLNAQTQVTSGMSGTELQAAIDAAESGTTVYVEAGTYYGNFTMKEGVNVSGGWNSTFTEQTDYATILDAQASGRVVYQPAAFSVLTVWSNLTIQNGKFTAAQADKAGAGVYLCDKGQVKHCLIQNNLFDATTGEASGGGVYENGYTTSVLVDDCIIRGNTASHAGGVRICGVIKNSLIENNTTSINACGGVQLHYGGAMYNCIVRGNTGKDTGGVRLTGTKACTMANCLIVGNHATNTVGGLQLANDVAHMVYNNVIVGNTQASSSNAARCGVHLNVAAAAKFVNNIVWGNTANGAAQTDQLQINGNYNQYATANFLNNAVVRPSTYGTSTILLDKDTDPGFTDAANGDYTLLENSSLVDAGLDNSVVGTLDLAGNARVSGSAIDMGCFEFQHPVLVDNYVHPDEDLQEAIDATSPGDTVFVEAGTYYGNFTMKNGVNVSGGWNSDFTAQTDYATILDAQASGRVVNQPIAFSLLTVWENLTIQNGQLTADQTDKLGAGVALNKNGQVKHCLIQNNIFMTGSNGYGGGVGNDAVNAASDILIDDCIIRNNQATHGGGVRIKGTIQNSIIEDNVSTANGGGVHLFNGGCMYNCIVRNNTANSATAGVRMSGTPAGVIANCLIAGNHTADRCGGLGLESSAHTVYGNTIVGNTQSSATNSDWCGVRVNVGGSLAFCNNIVWGNKANDVVQASQIMLLTSYAAQANNFAHNAVVWSGKLADGTSTFSSEDNPTGVNTIFLNKDTDPGFVDVANGDYHLTYPSELIDSGHNAKYIGTTDLDGNTRKQGTIDRGCYEYEHVTLAIDYEHLTLTLGGGIREAGNLSIPKGYTAAAQAVPAEGYYLSAITLNGVALTFDAEGQFTLPVITADATLAIDVVSMTTYEREVVSGNYGTICLPYAVSAADIIGCTPYRVLSLSEDGNGVILEQIDEMEAGKPYYFEASADHVSFGYVALGDAAEASSENGLYGTITGTTVSGAGKYIIQDNELRQTYNESASSAVAVELSGNRAYLLLSEVPAYVTPAPSARLRTLAIHREPQTPTAIDAAAVSGKWTKSIRNGQLVIERDGHVMNALGQELR